MHYQNSFIAIRLIVLIVVLLNMGTVMAQNDFKTVKEAKGLLVGESVSDFKALNADNKVFKLSDALKKGPVVIVFYRGQWCPVCNKHLKTLQDSLQLLSTKGVSVVAVSPEKVEHLNETAQKTGATFQLLYDEDYRIANLFDVAFKPSGSTTGMYNLVLGAKLKEAHSDDSQRLPIPATFVVGTNGKILWRHFDPDYKKRSTVAQILRALE
jgi:peroxiredoxin